MSIFGPYKNPGTMSNDASTGNVAWSNPDNAKTSDNAYAVAALNTTTFISNWLMASNFDFAIPAGATIEGVQISIEAKLAGATNWLLDYIRLVKGGSIGSTNMSLGHYGTTDSYITSAYSMFGTTISVSEANASNFGIAISTYGDSSNSYTISIDHIKARIKYTYTYPYTISSNVYTDMYSSTGIGIKSDSDPVAVYQSFLNVNRRKLVGAQARLSGITTGSIYAKIYAHSGTYGTSSAPTGSALATSDAVDAATQLQDTADTNDFVFSGSNQITLEANTHYVLVIFANTVGNVFVYNQPGNAHAGNNQDMNSNDNVFAVYGDTAPTIVNKGDFFQFI